MIMNKFYSMKKTKEPLYKQEQWAVDLHDKIKADIKLHKDELVNISGKLQSGGFYYNEESHDIFVKEEKELIERHPAWTTFNGKCTDFIFFNPKVLRVLKVLENPEVEEGTEGPSIIFPSDHVRRHMIFNMNLPMPK